MSELSTNTPKDTPKGTPKGRVKSFQVDHTKLMPGIYLVKDCDHIKVYDLRFRRPNVQLPMQLDGYHSLEHLLAQAFRSTKHNPNIIAVDAAACCTMFYLVIDCRAHDYSDDLVHQLVFDALHKVMEATEVPATTAEQCGNYQCHNLVLAKQYAHEYLSSLEEHLYTEYPLL